MFSVFSEESAQSEAEAGRLPRCKQLRRILPGAGNGFHCPYPVSDESGCRPGRQRGDDCLLRNDLEIAEACGSVGIVVHFGHFAGMEPLQGYQKIIQCMNEVLADWTGRTKLLLENMAGNHGHEGMTPEELVKVRELSRYPEKIGFASIPAMLSLRASGTRSRRRSLSHAVSSWGTGRIWRLCI